MGAKASYLILAVAANLTTSEAFLGANQGFQTWARYQSGPFRVAFQLAFWVYLVVLIVLGVSQDESRVLLGAAAGQCEG